MRAKSRVGTTSGVLTKSETCSWGSSDDSGKPWKCSELSDAALRTDSVAASSLSLMGIVRHLTDVERSWVRRTLAGEDAPRIYYSDTSDWDRQFTELHDVIWADTRRAWESEVRACDEVIARRQLDDAGTGTGASTHCDGFWSTSSRSTPGTTGMPT